MSMVTSLGQILTPKNATLGVIMTNMVCRPTITMSNKSIPEDTRKYTASREFCTELFGLLTTYTFATAVENIAPKAIAKKLGVNLTKELFDSIKKASWEELKNKPELFKIKGTATVASFVGTAIAVAILTPLLNNFILNKFMGKILGNKDVKDKKQIEANVQANTVMAGSLSNNSHVSSSRAFSQFLQDYTQAKGINKLV